MVALAHFRPTARLTFSENQGGAGASYPWKGNLVGEGSMTTTAIGTSKVDMLLRFITPLNLKLLCILNS
ncbi:MAG: hypothetical protein V3U78_05155 [Thiotrichaceae bacterium]